MKIVKRLALAALFFILAASIAGAQGIPQATNPEEVGLSKDRLQNKLLDIIVMKGEVGESRAAA